MKTRNLLLIILAVIIAVPALGRLGWALRKGRKMEIMIINKTVPGNSRNEVRSLNWVLNYNKILKTDNTHYRFERDYYGYHPDAPAEEWKVRSYRMADLPSIEERYSALVFLDNQGVKLDQENAGTSALYYGGFNQNDYLLLKEMLSAGKLVIAEYNFFSPPTQDLVRYNTEQMLDIHSLGWQGKYFTSLEQKKLSGQLDPAWIEHYRDHYGKDWTFDGPGIILINEKQGRIIVLPRREMMNKDFPDVVTEKALAKSLALPVRAAYTGWFDVVYKGNNALISTFDLNLNEKGREMMMKNGLECRFPAVIKSSSQHFYYLAGDFSKEHVSLTCSRLCVINNLLRTVAGKMTKKPGAFFQTYYVPVMSAILEEHFNEMNRSGV